MKVWMGVDVGLGGAVAFLEDSIGPGIGTVRPVVFDIPTLMVGKRRDYDVSSLASIITNALPPELNHRVVVGIERAGAMPKQGVSSTFSFGKGFGIWLGICAALRLPFGVVAPQRWKAAMVPGQKGKDAARLVAQRLFPDIDLSLKRHHGRADALLIAEYMRRLRP